MAGKGLNEKQYKNAASRQFQRIISPPPKDITKIKQCNALNAREWRELAAIWVLVQLGYLVDIKPTQLRCLQSQETRREVEMVIARYEFDAEWALDQLDMQDEEHYPGSRMDATASA